MLDDAELEESCRVMHDAYERAARREGWETQARSRVAWDDVPEANKAMMRAAVAALFKHWSLSDDTFREEVGEYRSAVNIEEQAEYHRDKT